MLSDKAIVENLNWSDDVAMDMIKDQRVIINKYYKLYMSLKEENRKLKVCCDYHDIDYKEDMNIEDIEYHDLKPYSEITKEDLENTYNEYVSETEAFQNMVKETVKPINVQDYCVEVIKEKEEEERQKLLDSLNEE